MWPSSVLCYQASIKPCICLSWRTDIVSSLPALTVMDIRYVHPIFLTFAISATKYHRDMYFKFAKDLYSYKLNVFTSKCDLNCLWHLAGMQVHGQARLLSCRSHAGLWCPYLVGRPPAHNSTPQRFHSVTEPGGEKRHRNRRQRSTVYTHQLKKYQEFSSSAANEIRISIHIYLKKNLEQS